MDDQIDDYLYQLTEVVNSVLKDRLSGLYLSGSAVMNDFDEEYSDLDILCVVNRPVREADKRKLAERLADSDLEPPGIGLEFVCVLEEETTNPHSLPSYEFTLVMQKGVGVKLKDEGMDEGLLMDFTICYQSGKTLAGKPAMEVIGAVPKPWLNEAMKGSLRWHKAHVFHPFHDPYGHEAVLNACRTWCFKENGRMTSKSKGAEWALKKWPHADVIRQAIGIREGKWHTLLEEEHIHQLLDHVIMMNRVKATSVTF